MDENLDLTKNTEISEALNEFESKEVAQIPQAPSASGDSEAPKMVLMVMKWFKLEQKQAEYILLGLVVIMIVFSLFLVFSGGGTDDVLQGTGEIINPITGEEIIIEDSNFFR